MLSGMSPLDPEDSRPSYRQLADQLTAAIERGDFAPGEQLPTHRALADEYGVAVETVKRALSDLRALGLIVTRQGKGSYVRRETQRVGRHAAGQDSVVEMVSELRREIETIKARLAALEARD